MPPWPWYRTAGTLSIGVFSPCWVTSQTGPTFSVISIRPSGRKAIRQGSLNVATWVIVNGRLASGFSSPALICACAVADMRLSSSAAFRSVFMYLLSRTFEMGPSLKLVLQPDPRNSRRDDVGRPEERRSSLELHRRVRARVQQVEQIEIEFHLAAVPGQPERLAGAQIKHVNRGSGMGAVRLHPERHHALLA